MGPKPRAAIEKLRDVILQLEKGFDSTEGDCNKISAKLLEIKHLNVVPKQMVQDFMKKSKEFAMLVDDWGMFSA